MGPPEPRRYRVLDVLGRGGFGTVYRGEVLGAAGFVKDVALKVLNADVEANPHHLARLRDEARVLGLVHHRALVGVDGLVRLFDRWTVVMEYVDGVALDDLLAVTGPLPVPIALQIVEEVASGLYAAYTSTRDGAPLRLLHRDVKPSNIRLTGHGEVKLLDFGVARAEYAEREAATGRAVFGSLPYLAPERLHHEDTHAADVFAVGATLAELVTGVVGAAPAPDPMRHADRVDETARRCAKASVPPDLVALIRRMLAWDPADRPDAREVERACRAIRTSLPDRHLGEWAEAAILRFRASHPPERGEFTGMVASEATTGEREGHLSALLGSPAPTTFDDPVTAEAAKPRPPLPAPAPTPALATPAPAPALARRRRRWGCTVAFAGFAAILAAGAAVALVVGSVTLGGVGMFGVLLAAALSDPEAACLSAVRDVKSDLVAEDVRGLKRASPVFDRAQRGCRDGSLGLFGGALFAAGVRDRAADGALTDAEIAAIDMTLTKLITGR